jgi:hypothetical protein
MVIIKISNTNNHTNSKVISPLKIIIKILNKTSNIRKIDNFRYP